MQQSTIASQLAANSCRWFLGRSCHPEAEAIVQILRRMREVMLPNYFPFEDVKDTQGAITELHRLLARQIHRAMFQQCYTTGGTEQSRTTANSLADSVIQRLPELQERLFEDVKETHNGDPSATGYDEIILTYPGILALMVYRAANILVQLSIPLLPRMMTEYAHRLTGIDLHPGATMGRGIMIDHGTGIVVGETAVVGDGVKFYQGVTLGALYFPRDEQGLMVRETKRHPTVESNVVLYANATVLGGDTVIGHDSVIGSNAWVTSSVAPFSKVLYQSESIIRTTQK
jgi:serine O-acetyltransferase